MARPVDLNALYGGHIAAPDVVLKGMAGLEQELSKRHNEQESQRATRRQYIQQGIKPLLDMIGKDQGAIQGVQGLSSLQQTSRKMLTPPVVPRESSRLFLLGGATVAPPYNYQWTWDVISGTPPRESVTANSASGQMHFVVDTDHDKSSAGSTAAAVGIYFSPFIERGNLLISANPTFSSGWATWCFFNSAHSDGWIGLYVGSYDLSGGFAGAPVSLQFSLWSENVFFPDGPGNGGVGTMPLRANLSVDSNHYYAIWVWCGGSASGVGWDNFFGSAAYSEMYVSVPSITWELS